MADFTDSQAVIIRNGGNAEVFGYKSEGGIITFDDTGTAVARQESWVAVVTNKLKALFTPQEQPAPNHKTEGDMPLTKEELEQIGSMIGQAVATNTDAAIKPLVEKVDALQANQQQLAETLTANSRAEEKPSVKQLRKSTAISSPMRCLEKRWMRCLKPSVKPLRWEPTMLSSRKKLARLPHLNTLNKEPE